MRIDRSEDPCRRARLGLHVWGKGIELETCGTLGWEMQRRNYANAESMHRGIF